MKLNRSPSPRPCAVRIIHRLEVAAPNGMTFDVDGWPGDGTPRPFLFAVAAADALRSGLLEPRWRTAFLPKWIRQMRRDLRALGIDPLTCTVRVVQPCPANHPEGEHGYITTHAAMVRPVMTAA